MSAAHRRLTDIGFLFGGNAPHIADGGAVLNLAPERFFQPSETMVTSGTEGLSRRFAGLDEWPTLDVLKALHEGQLAAVAAVTSALPALAGAVEAAAALLGRGKRAPHLCGRRDFCSHLGAGRGGIAAHLRLAAGAHRFRHRGRPEVLWCAIEGRGGFRRGREIARPASRGRRARRDDRRRGERHDALHGRGARRRAGVAARSPSPSPTTRARRFSRRASIRSSSRPARR